MISHEFAPMLAERLRQGVVDAGDFNWYRVSRRLDIGVRYVSLEVRLAKDLQVLRKLPPQAWCRERWMRHGDEWHNSEKSGMCWILNRVWEDALSWKGKTRTAVMAEGIELFFAGVTCLINRHYVAHLENLRHWDPTWDSWGHHEKGAIEYDREQTRRRASSRPNI